MQIQALRENLKAPPWLELETADGAGPAKTVIDKFPFVLGRGEAADLKIDSFRVSREHAAIEFDGRDYRIRDLGSTNGTFLNGQRIEQSLLDDGDVVLVANVEVAFFCPRGDRLRDTATQVMTTAGQSGSSAAARLIGEVRRAREGLLLGCVRTLVRPLVELSGERVFGYEVVGDESEGGLSESGRLLPADGRLASDIQEVRRLRAVEASNRLEPGNHLFVRVSAAELGADGWAAALSRLLTPLAPGWQLVVQIPFDVAHGAESDQLQRLSELGIGLAYEGFAGAHEPWSANGDARCDFLILAAAVVRGLPRSREHQRLIHANVAGAAERGCQVIAAGLRTHDEAELCRKLGCTLAEGPLFGPPRVLGES